MAKDTPNAERFGGPGSSHQDRDHPGKNRQPTGKKGGGDHEGPAPGEATNTERSRVSGGGGERDTHHTHSGRRS
ncbi:MAG: hypothetical protein AB7F35_07650 [Acetobacteraceae bacterium]